MLTGGSCPPDEMQDVQAFIRLWACSRLSVPSIGWVSDTLSYVSLPARSKVSQLLLLLLLLLLTITTTTTTNYY